MDEQKMRACAVEAAKRFSDEVANQVPKVKIERFVVQDFDLKVKGAYHRPLTKEWQLHFSSLSGGFSENWQIRYVPNPHASDEEHIEEIKELLQSRRSLR